MVLEIKLLGLQHDVEQSQLLSLYHVSPFKAPSNLSNKIWKNISFQMRHPNKIAIVQKYQHDTGTRGGSDCVQAMERNAYTLWQQNKLFRLILATLAKLTAHRSSAISCEIHFEGQETGKCLFSTS